MEEDTQGPRTATEIDRITGILDTLNLVEGCYEEERLNHENRREARMTQQRLSDEIFAETEDKLHKIRKEKAKYQSVLDKYNS